MKFPSSTQRNITILIVINAIFFGLYVSAFLMMKSAQEHTSALLNQLETDIQMNDALQSIEAVLADSQGDIQKLESYFVGRDGIVDFIETVESYGQISGVKTSIDFVGVEGGMQQNNVEDIKETLRIRFSTEGTWAKTMHFISLIERMPFSVSMERVSFVYLPLSESSLSFTPPKGVTLPKDRTWKGNIELTTLKLK